MNSADATQRLKQVLQKPVQFLGRTGHQLAFYTRAFALVPQTAKRYPKETWRLVAEVSLGTGALALIGGTVVVVGFLTAAAGVETGLQGYASLGNIGVDALTGFVSSYVNTRESAPVIAGVALTATVGAGFTAQLGAMRVSEEIDALEVMAVPSIRFLVTTRIMAGLIAVIPIYAVSLIMAYAATRVIVTLYFGQASGSYEHYFNTFLIPSDLIWSFAKALIMAIAVIAVCCYYGFHATGGPAGVGQAVGGAVRTSLIVVMVVDMAIGLAVWGGSSTLHISG